MDSEQRRTTPRTNAGVPPNRLGHSITECKTKKQCNKDGCQKSHQQLLHKATAPAPPVRTPGTGIQGSPTATGAQGPSTDQVNFAREIPFINLVVLPVTLEGPKGTVSTYLMLDNGSTLSCIEESIADQLGLTGEQTHFQFAAFQAAPATLSTRLVSLKVKSTSCDFSYDLENVKTVSSLNLRNQSVRKCLIQKWTHLRGIDLETYENKKPGILIGLDNPHLLLQLEHRIGKGNAPIAVRTPLGWTLMGNTSWNSREQYGYHIRELMDDQLHQLVKEQFSTEAFGVMPTSNKPRSIEDQRGQNILNSPLKSVEGGWETGLLWRDDEVLLPESRSNALKRLYSMEKKMDKDPVFAEAYVDKIKEYEQKGFARLLTKEETEVVTSKTYYLPHFMAYNPKKPGKLRFVFDAAAPSHGQSLNDNLLKGPDKMTSLPGILMKFRQRRVGITANIQDMFHRVKVNPSDAQAQRFLFRGMDRDREPDTYVMNVLIFGASCSPSCAQEAKNVNAAQFRQQYPEAYEAIVFRHFVDDYLDSCDSEEDALKMFKEVRQIQSEGGFNLCNWLCSSPEVMENIPVDLRANNMKSLDICNDSLIERVLGLFWKPDPDEFTFSLSFLKATEEILHGRRIPTKREVLSLVMSVYDPLGFLATLTIKAKIILQATWRSQIGWDNELPGDLFDVWKLWLCELNKIPLFRLHRCYSSNFSSADEIQLHMFCDASQEAFGVVAYFRIKKDDKIETAVVMGKARVAPMKSLTIPRMELQAAVLGCRLAEFIKSEHEIKINRTVYWSDSRTVVCWIRSDSKRYQTFVSQRVGEIQELSDISQWKWIPTLENVADELTRLHSNCDFTPDSRWLNGPSFLEKNEDEWPKERCYPAADIETDLEMKKGAVFHIQESTPIIDLSHFSSWRKLVNCAAYVLRFSNVLMKRSTHDQPKLSVHEMKEAEQWLCRRSQEESFGEDLSALREGKDLPKSSRLRKLTPYLDEGILRLRGRIDNAGQVAVDVRRPAILDPKHPYTRLLLSHFDKLCGHHGQERIVNEIRQQYYVFHLRSAVKRGQLDCQLCKNTKAKPIEPEMGQLPHFRLESNVIPFNKTGVDYFGPIEVVVKRSREKRYGVIFTCLSTRAIHLEVANSLSTDSCILAIRRFVGRRGCPAHIYSDNGTNFHGANNELFESLKQVNQDSVNMECARRGVFWHFNPPAAPHFGGSSERMVRSVKVALGNVLKQKNLSDEVLYTLMVEAEHTVNSHPLTHVPCDPNDAEALTPNHFLIGRSSNLQPIGKFDSSELYGRKQWRIVQHMANQFWKRWIREFLPTLLRREKWCQPTRPIQVGDVVLEVNDGLDRNQWPKGIIIQLYPGNDGVTRVVDVKMGNGAIYKRPVTKLCILDVTSDSSTSASSD